jgi:hypothetical protein
MCSSASARSLSGAYEDAGVFLRTTSSKERDLERMQQRVLLQQAAGTQGGGKNFPDTTLENAADLGAGRIALHPQDVKGDSLAPQTHDTTKFSTEGMSLSPTVSPAIRYSTSHYTPSALHSAEIEDNSYSQSGQEQESSEGSGGEQLLESQEVSVLSGASEYTSEDAEAPISMDEFTGLLRAKDLLPKVHIRVHIYTVMTVYCTQ